MNTLTHSCAGHGEEQLHETSQHHVMLARMKKNGSKKSGAILGACRKQPLLVRTTAIVVGLMLPLLSTSAELPKVRGDYLERYRDIAKYTKPMMKYVLIRGDSREAYLFAITEGKAKIIDKTFGGCGTYYEVIKAGKTVGYRVTREDFDGTSTADHYLLRRSGLVKQPGLPNKEAQR